MGGRLHLYLDGRRLALRSCGTGPVLPSNRGLVVQESMTSRLVVDALMMAVWRRGRPVALLHHSDQGSQYTSEHFQRLLDEQGITCSMSRAGEVWDNSAMENFFSSLKTERTARKVQDTRPGPLRCVRLHRVLLQPDALAFDARISPVPYSSSKLKKLRSVSTRPAAAHSYEKIHYVVKKLAATIDAEVAKTITPNVSYIDLYFK